MEQKSEQELLEEFHREYEDQWDFVHDLGECGMLLLV